MSWYAAVPPTGRWDTVFSSDWSHRSGVGVRLAQLTRTHRSFLLNHTAPQIGTSRVDWGLRFTSASTSVIMAFLKAPSPLLHPRTLCELGVAAHASAQYGRLSRLAAPHSPVRKETRRLHTGKCWSR